MRNKTKILEAIKKPNFNWYGRERFVKDFIKYLSSLEESTHICLNGVWGSGKTTTILGIKDKLKNIKGDEKPLVLYIDAWKYEHYEEPIFALIKVIEKEVKQIFSIIETEIKNRKLRISAELNVPLFNIKMSKETEEAYNQILNKAEYIDLLNKIMITAVKEFKKEKSNNLIIFVDELDRAKPEFVLKTLEMFHHLQDELPTHIVYSVDLGQLNSIIKHYYGYEYNADIFIHKVFDEVITLEKLTINSIENYILGNLEDLSPKINIHRLKELMIKYMKQEHLESLRTINKICTKLRRELNKGYFLRRDNFGYSNYFLGDTSVFLWEYVELLIVLIIYLLDEPLKFYNIQRGDSIEELFYFINSANRESDAEGIDRLIETSFNYNLEDKITYKDMDYNQRIEGLRRVFIPLADEFNKISVFSEFEVF